MRRAVFAIFVLVGLAHAGDQPSPKLDLHVVPTSIKSYRLLSMSMDDDGFIWAGAIHKVVHRYDPRTGKVEDYPMPYQATASSCICVGKKVYILGQTYPKLIIYDRLQKNSAKQPIPRPRQMSVTAQKPSTVGTYTCSTGAALASSSGTRRPIQAR